MQKTDQAMHIHEKQTGHFIETVKFVLNMLVLNFYSHLGVFFILEVKQENIITNCSETHLWDIGKA